MNLTTGEVAARAALPSRTLRRWVRAGVVQPGRPARKQGASATWDAPAAVLVARIARVRTALGPLWRSGASARMRDVARALSSDGAAVYLAIGPRGAVTCPGPGSLGVAVSRVGSPALILTGAALHNGKRDAPREAP